MLTFSSYQKKLITNHLKTEPHPYGDHPDSRSECLPHYRTACSSFRKTGNPLQPRSDGRESRLCDYN